MRTIYWFRMSSLRLHDHPALLAAAEGSSCLYPVFCLERRIATPYGKNRRRFLLESLRDLDAGLRSLNSRLIVLDGAPEVALRAALADWSVDRLAYQLDLASAESKRSAAAVDALAEAAGVQVLARGGHTMCDLDALLRRAGGSPTTSYAPFVKHFEAEVRAAPIVARPAPSRLPPVGGEATAADDAARAVPAPADVGLPADADAAVLVRGGESAALARLDEHLQRRGGAWAAEMEKPATSPMALEPFGAGTRSTTVLSPYLAFGCLSPRLFYTRLAAEAYGRHPKHAMPPVSLHGQLLWREFFHTCAHGTPNYERMVGNPICRQVPWGDDKEVLAAWAEGRTGYPWIDAAMTQLRREGWIHHLARHAVACFLTRGDLWQSWEKGAAVFEELLLDVDPALNAGNWMWLSASCFFYQYFRCYSPVAFPKKYDKDGAYVRRWLPALADFPAKYIYEPWKAPIADQKAAGCIIGKDYPKPIVAHDVASKANMAKMAEAYAAHKEGGGGGASKAAATPTPKRAAPAPAKKTKQMKLK